MLVIGCDPGYEKSAFVVWDSSKHSIRSHFEETNDALLNALRAREYGDVSILVIEQIESFGMAVGRTTFETVYWSGRFAEAFYPNRVERLPRRDIKIHLCHQARATDSNIRQALLDRFGPTTQAAMGTKKEPGPLYGISKHEWSALAVALTWADQHSGDVRPGVRSEF